MPRNSEDHFEALQLGYLQSFLAEQLIKMFIARLEYSAVTTISKT